MMDVGGFKLCTPPTQLYVHSCGFVGVWAGQLLAGEGAWRLFIEHFLGTANVNLFVVVDIPGPRTEISLGVAMRMRKALNY